MMATTVEQRYNEVEAECESVQDPFASLKAKQVELQKRLISVWRSVFPGANRESSAWRALSSEYGPDEPITHAINSEVSSVRLQHYIDQYRR
jgi:hypothetical protein